jgi:membrane-associated protein
MEIGTLVTEVLRLLTHPRELIEAFGPLAYLGLFGIIFAETGLFVGFFLPGDSLLFAAGVASAVGARNLELPLVILVCVAGAILGNLVGFAFGWRVGRPLFDRPDSRFFKRSHLLAAEDFYSHHGGKTIVLARFLPFVRTFAPIVAGIGHMDTRKFAFYTVVGGILWGAGIPAAGYLLGEQIPDIDRYLLPIIVLIILVSVVPPALAVIRERRRPERDPALPIVPAPRDARED